MLNYLYPLCLPDTLAAIPPATDSGYGLRFGGHAD
jgi:hypothetical protein